MYSETEGRGSHTTSSGSSDTRSLSLGQEDIVNKIVIKTAETMNRRGEKDVNISRLAEVIDNALSFKKGAFRCSVILNARRTVESLIDHKEKPA